LYDGGLKPAEGGQATSSAATGANALFYTDLRWKGKRRDARWLAGNSRSRTLTRCHPETRRSRVEGPYVEVERHV